MLIRVDNAKDVAAGQMRVFDVSGTKINVTSLDGHLYAFDCMPSMTPVPTGDARLPGASSMARP
jgi:hypothetical protein